MKNNKLMKIKNIILLLLSLLAFGSCKKYLDVKPLDKLTVEQAFSNESNLQLYTNSFSVAMLPDGPGIYEADVMTDITVPNIVPTLISGKLSPQDAGVWNFTNLRNINYFLEHYNNPAISQAARNNYAGVAKFFRAYFYFNLVKQYGDVPWYNHTLAVDDPGLYKPRDPRAMVMDSVLADINYACNYITNAKDNSSTQITKWVALALKSRICLFEGTYRKYHTETGLSSTANTWLQNSQDAANQLITSGQYKLQTTGAPEKDYRSVFISENPQTSEVILAAVYNNALKRWHNATYWFDSATLGARLGLSKSFVNTYLNIDGTPFTSIPGYDTLQFKDETKNRDLRLQQTIRAGKYARSDGSLAPPDFNVTYSGYHILKFSLDDKYYDTRTENYNSIPIIRYAEVLLNYAEAKAELGTFTAGDWSITVAALRTRAGITNAAMPTTVDPYMQTTFFPDVSNPALMEIRRERGIELAVEGFRYDDLKRWKAGKLLERPYDGLYVPAKDTPLDLNDDGKPDVAFVDKIPATKIAGVVYFLLDNNTSKLSQGTKGNLIWLSNIPKSYPDRDYLNPIAPNEIILNPNLKQNPGW
ncbi:RagB/SusD family nutrient uptake outer membrane protein [Mucilaginibacter sabulilitoris]|uniref:RagB/SusD family nutrient uptake outer membrane protein n=1 Tax=Mucilaginibacter sabulilitoris TaxID=1173583 RepID=A0ABZ0TX48_9SPHI|nr:RagB/SusD family nutrient uptake outer membrane protein [Mucilaginibacter sabulilitoris]WPU97087.1 RagB/SusD family nutrient uptake outer membrane protein [Mucilaginibacter sabulilitoris]